MLFFKQEFDDIVDCIGSKCPGYLYLVLCLGYTHFKDIAGPDSY